MCGAFIGISGLYDCFKACNLSGYRQCGTAKNLSDL